MAYKSAFWLSLCVTVGLASQAWAQIFPTPYLPDGPYVPTVTLNESQEGAAGLLPLPVPPESDNWNKQPIWNMQVVGFHHNQGRASSDDGWIENQNGRYILYMADSPGTAQNTLTGKVENNGTSLIDVTNPAHPVYLSPYPDRRATAVRRMSRCAAATLCRSVKNKHKWYLLRHDGSTNQEIWDVTDPSHPTHDQRADQRT